MARTAVTIIPARLESSRLQHKALADIEGLPMVIHTCKRALLATKLRSVFLATDSSEIKEIAESYGINVIMTSSKHRNASERCAEACQDLDDDIVVVLQGDEPLVYPDHIDKLVQPMIDDNNLEVTMGITKFCKLNSYSDIKAVIDKKGYLLYASRNDIPCYYNKEQQFMWKLCFIVPHRKDILQKYLNLHYAHLDLIEDNHFLRFIENDVKIRTIEIDGAKISVDTQEDLDEIRELFKKDTIKFEYL